MRMRHCPRGAGLVLAALALTACGAAQSPSQLLKDTFAGSHKVTSGNIDVDLTLTPSGSSTLTSPITLSFKGPFQDFGKGRVPNSEFTLSLSALDRSLLSIGLESLDGRGYVSLGGASYALPASAYRQIEAGLRKTGTGSASSAGILGKLGIDPLRWLIDPTVAGSATVGGASTTHIRAGVNLGALVDDIGTFLSKASSLGVPGAGKIATSISSSAKAKILAAVRVPRVDIWTGTGDNTLRKLAVSLTIPVTGATSSQLGGLKSAAVTLAVTYQDLNQPQRITAPAGVQPFSQFKSQLQTLLGAVRSVVAR